MVIPKEVIIEDNEDTEPACFSYFDGRDRSCRRCGMKKQCKKEFEITRPECFGLDYQKHDECTDCIDASQCVEKQQGDIKMAQRTRTTKKRTSRARRSRRPKVEPEPVIVEEEEMEEDSYTEWSVPDLREELEARDLDTKGRKSVLVKRLIAADDDEPEPEPEPKKRVRRTRTAVKVAKPEEKVDEPEPVTAEVDVQGSTPLSDVTMAIINMLEVGKAVTLTAISKGYTITLGGVAAAVTTVGTSDQVSAKAKPVKKGLRGKAYDDEVESVEYVNFDDVDCGFEDRGWHDLSTEEKFEHADELGVEVQEHDNEKVMLMRLKPAVLKALGIKKYKPEYQTRAARKALKEGTG